MLIWGDKSDLFSHCVALGLATILANEGRRVRIGWQGDRQVCIETDDGLDDAGIAESVIAYAKKVQIGGWVAKETFGCWEGNNSSPLSPRVGKDFSDNCVEYGRRRRRLFDGEMKNDRLAQTLFSNLGRPSYWSLKGYGNKKEPAPDYGASNWEMFNRARGSNFVGTYYSKMCQKVVGVLPDAEAAQALRGEGFTECMEGDLLTHGLCSKSTPVDLLQLWCAVHSFDCFPTRPVVSAISASTPSNSTGYLRIDGKVGYFCIPVFNDLVYFERFKAALRSKALYEACAAGMKHAGALNGADLPDGVASIYAFERAVDDSMTSNVLYWAKSGKRVF